MAIPVWEKLVSESFSIGLDFTGHLPDTTTISSGTAAAYDVYGNSATSSVLLGTSLTIDGDIS